MLTYFLFGHRNDLRNILTGGAFLSILTLCGCQDARQDRVHYSKDQIQSLRLDSTQALPLKRSGMEGIDLNDVLETDSFSLDGLIDSARIVLLETNEKSVVNNISKIVFGGQYIYVMDDYQGNSVAIFDKRGKFVRRLAHGKGHGELFRLYDIDYDWNSRRLVAYQHSSLLFYTPDGKFLDSKILPLGGHDFAVDPRGGGYLFKSLDGQGNEHLGHFQDCTLLLTDTCFRIRNAGMAFDPHNINYGLEHNLHTNGKSVFVSHAYSDTVYEYRNGVLHYKYAFSYKRRHMPKSLMKGTFRNFEKAVIRNDYFFYVGNYLNAVQSDFFCLENWHRGNTCTIYHDCQTGHLVGGNSETQDLTQIPFFSSPIATFGNFYVALHYYDKYSKFLKNSKLLSQKEKALLGRQAYGDNPALVFYHLKKF